MTKTSQRINAWFFKNHRWFGIVSCVFVLMWSASGVLHPIMSRLSPKQAAMLPPSVSIALLDALAPAEVLARAGIDEVAALRVVQLDGVSYYQVTLLSSPPVAGGELERGHLMASFAPTPTLPRAAGEGAKRYFNVQTGEESIDADARYAETLARHFVGDSTSTIARTTLLTKFDDDYLDSNRLLPVYRVDFARDDGIRAYVETNPGRVGALVNDTRAALGSIFEVLHTWSFADGWDAVRKGAITLLLVFALVSAVSGAWIYVFMYKRRTLSAAHAPLRRWHRGIAIAVALSTVLFVISAVWHLWGSEPRGLPQPIATRFAAASLSLPDAVRHGKWSSVVAMQVDGTTYFELVPAAAHREMAEGFDEHAEHSKPAGGESKHSGPASYYVNATTGEVADGMAAKHALSLAHQYSGLDAARVTNVEAVFKFEGEYGFINKRLPVWRVSYDTPDNAAYYVETASGALAAIVRNADRAEGYSFAFLHKYHWLDFAGKNVRDFVMASFAFGMTLTAGLGLWMFGRRYVS